MRKFTRHALFAVALVALAGLWTTPATAVLTLDGCVLHLNAQDIDGAGTIGTTGGVAEDNWEDIADVVDWTSENPVGYDGRMQGFLGVAGSGWEPSTTIPGAGMLEFNASNPDINGGWRTKHFVIDWDTGRRWRKRLSISAARVGWQVERSRMLGIGDGIEIGLGNVDLIPVLTVLGPGPTPASFSIDPHITVAQGQAVIEGVGELGGCEMVV